jgi:hypothetical protein
MDMKVRFAVEYVCGYLGCGVNEYRREYCSDEAEAHKRAEELKAKGYIGVAVIRTW